MDFLSDLGKKITSTAKTVSKKSEDLVEITKHNLAIVGEEDKIKRMFSEIGSDLYKHYLNGESFGEYFDGKCIDLKLIETNIASLKEKIVTLKGSKVCKGCGDIIDYEVKYCPHCGAKSEEIPCLCDDVCNQEEEACCDACTEETPCECCCEEEKK